MASRRSTSTCHPLESAGARCLPPWPEPQSHTAPGSLTGSFRRISRKPPGQIKAPSGADPGVGPASGFQGRMEPRRGDRLGTTAPVGDPRRVASGGRGPVGVPRRGRKRRPGSGGPTLGVASVPPGSGGDPASGRQRRMEARRGAHVGRWRLGSPRGRVETRSGPRAWDGTHARAGWLAG